MNSYLFRALRGQLLREVMTVLLFSSLMLQSMQAAAPAWWNERNVLNSQKVTDDYAVLNQGQLKNIVRAAIYELHAKLPGGAGNLLNNLLNIWRTQKLNSDDYAAVTVGQLKAVTKPVYASMQAAGLQLPLPWTAVTSDDDDYAVANVGQAKSLFAFVVPNLATQGRVDTDGDGFSDALEQAWGTDPNSAASHPVGITGDMAAVAAIEGGVSGNGLPAYEKPYESIPWPDFDAPEADSDGDGVPDSKDRVPYDPSFADERSGMPHYSIIDLGVGTFIDMADNGALYWAANDGTKYVWTPEHPEKLSFHWDPSNAEDLGLENVAAYGAGPSLNPTISEEGEIAGVAHYDDQQPGGYSENRLFLYNPYKTASESAEWLPRPYPNEDDRYDNYALGDPFALDYSVFGPGGKVYSYIDFFRGPVSSAVLYNTFFAATAGGVDFQLTTEFIDESNQAVVYAKNGSSGTGYLASVSRPSSNTLTWYLLMEDGRRQIKEITLTNSQDAWTLDSETSDPQYISRWYLFGVSPAEVPWLLGSKTKGDYDDSLNWSYDQYIFKPDALGTYVPCSIYASEDDYNIDEPINSLVLITAQGQVLVSGKFEEGVAEEDQEEVLALWADGKVEVMSNLISGYDSYENLTVCDVTKDGMFAANATPAGEEEEHMLLLVPVTAREIKEDGTFAEGAAGVQASLPSPVFCESVAEDGKPDGSMSCVLQNLRVQADGTLLGDLKVNGTLASKACDHVAGDLGKVSQALLWINGAETSQATITLDVTKLNDGPKERPFPFTGKIPTDTLIADIPLTEGVNTFKFTAEEPSYHTTGSSTWSVTINVTDPTEAGGTAAGAAGTFALQVQLPLPAAALSPDAADIVQAMMNLNGTVISSMPMTETSAASGVFSGTLPDGRPARLTLNGALNLSPSELDLLQATLLVGQPGTAVTYQTNLRETNHASGLFAGGYTDVVVGGAVAVPDGLAPVVVISDDAEESLLEAEKTTGGEYHGYAIAVGVPEELEGFKLSLGDVEYELMKDEESELMLLKAPEHLDLLEVVPYITSFMIHLDEEMETPPGEAEADPDADDDAYSKRLLALEDATFDKGLVWGLGFGGLEMLKVTGETLSCEAEFSEEEKELQIKLSFDWVADWIPEQDDPPETEWVANIDAAEGEEGEQGKDLAKFLGALLPSATVGLRKDEVGLLMGDEELEETALYGGETHRQLFRMTSEVLTQAVSEVPTSLLEEGQKGYILGKILYEGISFIIPETKEGKMMEMTKSELLAKLHQKSTHLGSKLLGNGTKTLVGLMQAACEASCFAPGTLVLTSHGSRPIEMLKKNDLVWSSNEHHPVESGWKQVRRTFTHEVSRLHRLTLECGGLAGAPHTETLGLTPEHPVWVIHADGTEGFVAAAAARVGEHMRSAQGMDVTITASAAETPPPGGSFTVHNFEVADYHTYHVARSGVLVHNDNGCAWLSLFDDVAKSQIVKRAFFGGVQASPADLWRELLAREEKTMSQREKSEFITRFINGGLDDVKEMLDSHFLALATDPSGLFAARIGFVGARFEAASEKHLQRSGDSSSDFVDDSTPPQKWDALGPFSSEDIPASPLAGDTSWLQDIADHFSNPGAANPIIDLAGLDGRQQKLIIEAVYELKKQYPDKDFWIVGD